MQGEALFDGVAGAGGGEEGGVEGLGGEGVLVKVGGGWGNGGIGSRENLRRWILWKMKGRIHRRGCIRLGQVERNELRPMYAQMLVVALLRRSTAFPARFPAVLC